MRRVAPSSTRSAASSATTERRPSRDLLKSVNKPSESIVATVVGIGTLLIGATTVFGELQDALNRIWRAPALVDAGGLWNLLRRRLLAFGMILTIGFLMIVSLVLSAILAAVGTWLNSFAAWEIVLHVINFAISFGVTTVLFAMIYKIMPRVNIAWRDVWLGAAVTSLLFSIGKFLIGLYIGKTSVASGFGAAGSLAVLLVWIYYSTQVFLMGAEFTWVYANLHGSRKGKDQVAHARAGGAGTKRTGRRSRGAQRARGALNDRLAVRTPAPGSG